MSKLLTIDHCANCPHSTRVSDPGSDDSFDATDEAMLCKLTGPYNAGDRTFPHRTLVRASRLEREFMAVTPPKWCPLPDARKS